MARGEVVIDRTPIGDFAEIEGHTGMDRPHGKGPPCGPQKDYITASYAELFLSLEIAHRKRRQQHDLRRDRGTAHP